MVNTQVLKLPFSFNLKPPSTILLYSLTNFAPQNLLIWALSHDTLLIYHNFSGHKCPHGGNKWTFEQLFSLYPLLFHSMWPYHPGLIINCTIIVINQVEKGPEPSILRSFYPSPLHLSCFSSISNINCTFLKRPFSSSFSSLPQWVCTPPSSACCSCFASWPLPWLVRSWTGS